MSAGLRRRIRTGGRLVSSGGTPGAGANVPWGPDFGNPTELEVGVARPTMPSIVIVGNKVIGVNADLWSVAANYNAQGVGVQPLMPQVGISASRGVGAQLAMPFAALLHEKSIGSQILMPAAAIAHERAAAAHCSGSMIGAPFVIAVTTATSPDNAQTSFTLPAPAGMVDGDVMIVIVGIASATVTPSGSAEGFSSMTGSSGTGLSMYSFYKRAASESGDYTFTLSAGASYIATLLLLRGAKESGTPRDAFASGGASATDPVAATMTTTVANTLKICACVQTNTLNADYTPPAGYTEQSDLNGLGVLGGLSITGEVATRPQNAAGASGTATMDSSQALASNYVSLHLAIAPGSFSIAS